jgi:hypothetical protein
MEGIESLNTMDEYHPPAVRVRLPSDRIGEAIPGDIITHPEGYLVELVRCHADVGYWFWYRVDEDTLSRLGPLDGGAWAGTARAATDDGVFAKREVELLSANQKRRDEVMRALKTLHDEIGLLSEISGVLYANILKASGRKLGQ